MKKLTVQQVEENFDEIMSRVENGKSFVITSEFGDAILIPYKECMEIDELYRIYTENNNEAS